MTIKPIDIDEDYPVLCGWWSERNLPPPPKIVLESARGIIVRREGEWLCAAWFYLVNDGRLGMIEWMVSNPRVKQPGAIKSAVSHAYDFFEQFAKTVKCPVLFTTTPHDASLGRFLNNRQWLPCKGKPHVYFVKSIKNKTHEIAA